jgi:hypothetical protein
VVTSPHGARPLLELSTNLEDQTKQNNMKTQSIIFAGLLMISGVMTARAQEINEPAVKILPTAKHGIIKVLYAYNSRQSVRVRFFDEDGELLTDKIKANEMDNGFIKKYDVRNIASKVFFVEVSSEAMSFIYKLTASPDGKGLTPVLENASYQYPAVAARN